MDRAAGKAGKAGKAEPAVVETPSQQAMWTLPSVTPTRLILVRHGSTAHSAEKRFSGRNELPLSDVGRAQATALADRLGRIGTVEAIASSPLLRCRQTAEAVATKLGLAVEVIDDLAEVDFGAWEGLTFAEVENAYPAEMAAWLASTAAAPPGGESFAAAGRRVSRARESILAAHPGAVVAVVTHVTPIKTLIRLALDAPPASLFRIHLDTASLSIIDYFGDDNCSVRLVNDTAHLITT
jgi:probable phosphoglycerate mutase